MPIHVYTVEIDGHEYDLEGDHEPSEAEARAAVGASAPAAPPKKATPPPASATIGMIAPSTATSRAPTGTLMDLIPSPEQNRVDMARRIDALPLAVPGALGDVTRLPGIIAQAAKLPATKQAAKVVGKYALKRGAEAAGAGSAYYALKKIFGD